MRTSIHLDRCRSAARATLAAALASVAVGAVAVVAPSDAHALGDVVCAGTASTTFAPGLTNTPQSVLVTANDAYTCLSLTNPAIRSATSTVAGSATRSCTDLLGSGILQFVNSWNTGDRSTVTANYVANYVSGQFEIALHGTVTAGLFRGSTIVADTTQVADLTDCDAPGGLTGLFGPSVFSVVL